MYEEYSLLYSIFHRCIIWLIPIRSQYHGGAACSPYENPSLKGSYVAFDASCIGTIEKRDVQFSRRPKRSRYPSM
jgi:hypothetical protein